MKNGKKRTITDILFAVLVVIVLGILGYKFLRSDFLRFNVVKQQFKNEYGIALTEGSIGIGDKSFLAKTEDGFSIVGKCDWIGNIQTETYINYYYADETVEIVENEIGACFDDCIIIADYSHTATDDIDFKSIHSFDEYLSVYEEHYGGPWLPNMVVLLRETEDIDHVREALEILDNSEYRASVVFYRVPDDFYDAHVTNGIYCYARTSSPFMEKLLEDHYGLLMDILDRKYHACGLISPLGMKIDVDGELVAI